MAGVISPALFTASAIQVVTASVLASLSSGKTYDAQQKLRITLSSPSPLRHVGGWPMNEDGELFCTQWGGQVGPLTARRGLLFDSTGALMIVEAASAVLPLAVGAECLTDANGALVTVV